jgi:ComF family protein
MSFYTAKRNLISFIYPNRCPFCDVVIKAGEFFCAGCAELDFYENDRESSDVFCCVYNDKSKPLLSKAKENADGYAISAAAKLLHDALVKSNVMHKIDVIVPVPARKAALRERGYSFPALLAKELAGLSGRKYEQKMLVLLRETEEQKELSAEERAENLKGAFAVRRGSPDELSEKNVLVIDDVSTTGATLAEAKRVLEARAGVVFTAAFLKTL